MVMMWSAPATLSMLATSLAEMGARLFIRRSNEAISLLRHKRLDKECIHLVFFVLTSVREDRNDSGDSGRRGDLAGVDHDEQLHDVVVDVSATALNDEHVLATHRLAYLHAESSVQR